MYRQIQVNKVLTFGIAICVVAGFAGFGVTNYDYANEAGIVGLIVGSLVGVLVASALLPTIANQTAVLETDTAGDLSTGEESLIGTWILLVIVGVMLGIIGLAL